MELTTCYNMPFLPMLLHVSISKEVLTMGKRKDEVYSSV